MKFRTRLAEIGLVNNPGGLRDGWSVIGDWMSPDVVAPFAVMNKNNADASR